jgi:hypothetical protein
VRKPVEEIELALIYERYENHPYPLETRTPNLFVASATVALLGIWAGRISRRWWMGLLAATAYATNPEVFVRSSYGGYFAIGSLAAALMLLASEKWRRWPTRHRAGLPVVTGALAALADHKLVLLPAAMALHDVVTSRSSPTPRDLRLPLNPVVIGFGLGTILFWVLGFTIAPAAFLEDHFHHHLLDRVIHENPLEYWGYPSALGLWQEFSRHTGYVLLPVGLLLMIHDLVRTPIQLAHGRLPQRGLWVLWMLLTAVVFTVVDWRMTKHLVPILFPIHLGLVPTAGARPWRTTVPTLTLLFLVAYNAWVLASLMQDFAGFRVTPDW